tara:strand:+ start:1025 stop:1252 length:228 start_codon:yes stop_codon:yes gene_type:complete
MRVEVRNGNVDQAIRILKKKLQQDGLFNELREREYYMSKSEKRRRSKAAAIRRQKREDVKREEEAYSGQTKKNRR